MANLSINLFWGIVNQRIIPARKKSPGKGGKGAFAGGVLIVALVGVGCTATGGEGGAAHGASASVVTSAAVRSGSQAGKVKRPQATPTSAAGPAQKLAVLDGTGRPAEQYQQVLDALAPRCTEGRSRLVDVVGATLRDLRRHRVEDADAFGVLQQLERSVSAGNPRINCASAASAYAKEREAG